MVRNILSEKTAIVSYIFFSSLLSGLVLIGISSSFALMLSENGIDVSTITHILLATIPYSWKFAISPFIKNLIVRYRNSTFNVVKITAYASQALVFCGFSALGFLGNTSMLLLATLNIFFIVLAVSVHDILRAHMKLVLFKPDDFGFISAVENTGFRLGMFTAGVCIVYIANAIGWQIAFIAPAFAVSFSTIATFFVKFRNDSGENCEVSSFNFFKNYIKVGCDFFKTHGIIALVCVIVSFKVTDSAINGLKPMFIHFLGIGRVAFANMVHLYGLATMTIAGIVAGIALGEFTLSLCIRCTFLAQAFVSLIFVCLIFHHDNLLTVTILVNVATFVFGFCSVVFRTFIAHISKKDVNIYTIFLSIGSLIRICMYSIAGFIIKDYSWSTLFLVCLSSNIPGYCMIKKFLKRTMS